MKEKVVVNKTHNFEFAQMLVRKYGNATHWIEEKYIKGEIWFYIFSLRNKEEQDGSIS